MYAEKADNDNRSKWWQVSRSCRMLAKWRAIETERKRKIEINRDHNCNDNEIQQDVL